MSHTFIIEACVETLTQAIKAEKKGAQQIELCADLVHGGLTPSLNFTAAVLSAIAIPVKVMIRPRAGNFVFSNIEIQLMHQQIRDFRALGIQHFVIGMATSENELDMHAIRKMCTAFDDAYFTIHKVIDVISSPLEAILAINTIPNVHSILTSGGAATALAGASQIRQFNALLQGDKTLIAAGKITNDNLAEVHAAIGTSAYHGRKILGDLD